METGSFLRLPVSGWMFCTASHSSWALSTSGLTTATVRKGDPLSSGQSASPSALSLAALRYPLHEAAGVSFQKGRSDVPPWLPGQNPPGILHNSQGKTQLFSTASQYSQSGPFYLSNSAVRHKGYLKVLHTSHLQCCGSDCSPSDDSQQARQLKSLLV